MWSGLGRYIPRENLFETEFVVKADVGESTQRRIQGFEEAGEPRSRVLWAMVLDVPLSRAPGARAHR